MQTRCLMAALMGALAMTGCIGDRSPSGSADAPDDAGGQGGQGDVGGPADDEDGGGQGGVGGEGDASADGGAELGAGGVGGDENGPDARALTLAPSVVDFGRVVAGTTPAVVVRVTNTADRVVSFEELHIDGSAQYEALIDGRPLRGGGEPDPWSDPDGDGVLGLAPGATFEVVVRLHAVDPGLEAATLVIEVGEVEARTVPLRAVVVANDCPVAAMVDARVAVDPLGVVTLDASPSRDPDGPGGRPVRYAWTVVDRPEGSVSIPRERFDDPQHPTRGGSIDDPTTPGALFIADLVGEYVIELHVVDAAGATAPSDVCPGAPAQVTVVVDAPPGILVQLTWDTPGDMDQSDDDGTDLDLSLLHPAAMSFSDPLRRCDRANSNPDWGELRVTDDNPRYFVDDADGAGPEDIALRVPEDTAALGGAYRVGVHYYRSSAGVIGDYGPSLATVRIYLDGMLAHEGSRMLLDTDDFWEPAAIHWTDDRQWVEVVDAFFELPPR